MTDWTPTSLLAHLVDLAGFRYDPEQDIIYTRRDALQRQFGYAYGYDRSAPLISADIDCEPIFFDYGGKHWMIELWKGQYGLETGCEIGVYNRPIANPPWYYPVLDATVGQRPPDPAHAYYYACASDAEMLMMASRLRTTTGAEVFHRGPERHWWLTGFKWGVYSDPSDLVMDVDITFPDDAMTGAFTAALKTMGYTYQADGRRVQFVFVDPKTRYQPRLDDPRVRAAVLAANTAIVETYRSAGLPNNDPNRIPGWLAVRIESVVTGRSADLFGRLVADAMKGVGQSADTAVKLIGSGLAIAVRDFEAWITAAGYSVAQWFASIGTFLQMVFEVDDSCCVEVVNLGRGGRAPTTMRLVDSGADDGSHWAIQPPTVIRPGQRYRFYLKDPKGPFTSGATGHATYAYIDEQGNDRQVRFSFSCPFAAWNDNSARSSDPAFKVYARSGNDNRWHDSVPKGGHPLYAAFVWDGGPPPS